MDDVSILCRRLQSAWLNTLDDVDDLRRRAERRACLAAELRCKLDIASLPCFAAFKPGLQEFLLAFVSLPSDARGSILSYFAELKKSESVPVPFESIGAPLADLDALTDDLRLIVEAWERIPGELAAVIEQLATWQRE